MNICEGPNCEQSTEKRFCRQACRSRWTYHNNPDSKTRQLTRNKANAKSNPEAQAEYQKRWYQNGGKAVRDAWRAENREQYNKLVADWNKTERGRAYNVVTCNARRVSLEGKGRFTLDEWLDLCQKYEFKCINCGKAEQHADHVIPLSRGGMNTIDNIQPLCKSCNSSKGTKDTDYR